MARNESLLNAMPAAQLAIRRRKRADTREPLEIVEWAEENFLIAQENEREGQLIHLEPHQKAILKYVFSHEFSTVIWSTPKKSGKTTVAAMVARWVAEEKGRFQEIYFVANDFEQAKSRAFNATMQSVALNPKYNVKRRRLEGQWAILDREMTHIPTGSKLKALATDYKGEAGAEPTLTVWTELWGYTSENSQRFWTEMTPTPTRKLSMRWVETYAGFEGESLLLERLYHQGKEGRQLTANELGDLSAFREAPNWDSLVPCWVNDNAGLFMYWDEGMIARRMPWQLGEWGEAYYRTQEHDLLPNQFERLHFNHWAASEGAAIPMEWWDACMDALTLPAGSNVPVVLGVDAGVSGDCTALTMVARHPQKHDELVELLTMVWYPPQGGKMDYRENLTPAVDNLIANHNVVQVAYDEYQLHHWANEQRSKEPSAWYRAFGQQAERLVADKQLYDLVRDRRLHHSGNPELRAHIQGCNAKIPGDEENRMRFVKRSEESKIDAAVALSMACAESLRLNL